MCIYVCMHISIHIYIYVYRYGVYIGCIWASMGIFGDVLGYAGVSRHCRDCERITRVWGLERCRIGWKTAELGYTGVCRVQGLGKEQ